MNKKLKTCFYLFIALLLSNRLEAQTNITSSGTFAIGGESFTSSFHIRATTPSVAYQSILVTSNRNITVTEASTESSTCNDTKGAFEKRKYRFAKNRSNSMQMFAIFKTVFPPQRCVQLASATFKVEVSIFPNSNSINATGYFFDSRINITQEEIAQLDSLIRTTTNFTFPKVTGICNNISIVHLDGIRFKFSELHTNPYYNGIGASFDGY